MKQWVLGLLLSTVVLSASAQSVDEQLLAAQMAYQQGNAQLNQAESRLTQATEAKKQADERLQEAQAAVERSNAELTAAVTADASAKQIMNQLSSDLRAAWQRKDAGQ